MGIEAQIDTLEKLVAIDAEIQVLSARIGKQQGEIDGARHEVEGLDQRLGADRAAVVEMDRTRADLVQELRQILRQLERSRERLQRSRNEREVNAAERELDELRKLQRDRDEELKKLTELCEQARQTIQKNDDRRLELTTELESSAEGTAQSIAALRSRLAELTGERKGVLGRLPTLTARRYESVQQRGRVPVAKTHDGTCLGCYVGLPPMLFHSLLARTEFGECPNCHRILYYSPRPAPDPTPAADAPGEPPARETPS